MKLLAGGTKGFFGELFAGHYLDARVLSRELTYATDGSITGTSPGRDCSARVDGATEAMRQADGYTSTDRAIFILASTLTGALDTGAQIEILEGDYAGNVFSVASIDRPPGASYFLCRGVLQNG